MAFIATPAFSNLYSSNLLSIAQMAPQAVAALSAVSEPTESETRTSSSVYHNQTARSSDGSPAAKQKKLLDPFDPDASVPLPHQLEDQFGPFTTSVWKRNERERYRVRCVNDGYERLRRHLPLADGEKRISKVDTLRLAVRYIRHLDAVLTQPQHLLQCSCFDRFCEESEGNVSVMLRDGVDRIRYNSASSS